MSTPLTLLPIALHQAVKALCSGQCLVMQDNVVEIEDLVPVLNVPAEQAAILARQSFIPMSVAGDRQYLLSLRHGTLADRNTLFKILTGTYLPASQ